MPLLRDPFTAPEAYTIGVGAQDKPDPAFLETLGAAFRYENLIGSALSSARMDIPTAEFHKVDPEYNPFDDIQGYEDFADRFEQSYNARATAAIKADIDRERQDRDTLDRAGMTGFALSAGASILDPTILLPGGAFVRSGKLGYSVGRSALAVGGAAAAGVAVQEAGLQSIQETRTATESALAVGGSAILGGLVGAAGAKFLSKGDWSKLSTRLEEEIAEDVPNPREIAETIVSRMQSVGAASVEDVKLDDLGVGGPKVARVVAQVTDSLRLNPGVQSMMSPSKEMRKAYAQLVDNPIYSTMNMEGRSLGPDVENLVKQYQRGAMAEWTIAARQGFKAAKKAGFQGTRDDFMARVAQAGRKGDVDPMGDEFVTKAAQDARAKIFDPLLEKAQQAGLLPEDVKVTTAASYVTRFWNRQRLIGEEARFKDIARKWLRQEIAKVPEDARPDFINDADVRDYIEEIVASIFNNLTGRGTGDIPEWIVPVRRGPLKERTFSIPDNLVEDFLENDMELILRRYTRSVPAEIELANKFGSPDMKDTIKSIREEYAKLREAAADKPKEIAKLEAREAQDIQNLEAFRDMIRGTYRAADENSDWSRITRAALTWNYIRLLGGVTLTSLTDTSRLIGEHGIRATMREALPALVSNIKAVKISRADAKALGAVTETVLNSRLATLMELNDPYRYGSRYERFLSNVSNGFSRATGLSWWNDTMKTMASVMTQNRMARNAIGWASAGKNEKAFMAMLGINEDMAQRIAAQLEKHGVQEQGVWGANVRLWDDEPAARAWASALNKSVDKTIVTKGVADQPLWTRTNWGKLIFQFRSFMLASHQRVLISGLQNDQHRLAEMLVIGTSIGMLISYLKYIERGDFEQAERLLDNPGLWVSDGLDRSGILGIPYDISNTAEKLGLPGFTSAVQAIAGDEDRGGTVSRYASRGAIGALAGPSSGIIEDLVMITNQLSKGDLKESGANALIRQVPGATLPGARTAVQLGLKPWLKEAAD